MNSFVIYASHTGNTRKVAETIADVLAGHGSVDLSHAEETAALPEDLDLLVVGGPTEGHGPTPEVRDLLTRLAAEVPAKLRAAAFDTRLGWPKWLSGSAASAIAERLREAGATLVAEPESFIVSTKPELQPGELDRARSWAESLAVAATNVTAQPAVGAQP